jgi:VanZ family protein
VAPLRRLIATWDDTPGTGNFLANVLLYLPYGLFGIPVLRRWPNLPRVLAVMFSGLVLSVPLELAQPYVVGRVPELTDVYANTLGSLAGATAGTILFRKPRVL